MKYRLHLVIPGLPKPFNQMGYQGRWVVKKEKDIWLTAVSALTRGKTPPQPLKKAKLTLVRHSSTCPDYSGLVTSMKFIEDALVRLGILEDDNMDVIGKPDYDWVKAKPKAGFVEVTVEEIDG